jgi:hypothetical protein
MARIHSQVRLLHDIPAERLQTGDVGEILAIFPLSEGGDEMLYFVELWRRDAAMLNDDCIDLDDAIRYVDLRADEFVEVTYE